MDNDTKHTPGPWGYWPNSAYRTGVISEAHGPHIAVPTDRPELVANARLIAAAPELLSACQRALQALTTFGMSCAADACREAIAKATGQDE